MRKSLTIVLSIFFWIVFISCANEDDNTMMHNIETALMITDDNLIWNWANGKGFTAALTELDFSPYETKTFEETWDQVSNDGRQASVDMYDAYVINTLSAGEIIAGPYSLEIR